MNLFRSARLKLTVFYFAVLAVFCLLLTYGVHSFTNYEIARGEDAQRTALHQLFRQYSDETYDPTVVLLPGDQTYATTQEQQSDATLAKLNRDFMWMDAVLLAAGAVLSYWYAGRTLKPIEEAHEQQKRFTSDASHELRTPLASMRLENEVFLRAKHFSEAEAREQIASNLEEVDRLEKLATNLLALNRYEQGKVAHAPVVISQLVDEAVAQVQRSPLAAKVKFKQDVAAARVDVNRESLVELLTILLDNAVKYGPRTGTVEIGGKLRDDHYVLTVRDHGPGITDEDLPHVFERMYRGDKARSSAVAGHGIGLSLARQIAKANDATLKAGNAPKGGAVFTLTLV